ncbi:hypothetical protein [Sphingomonas sp. SRS2]|uniref:hypothetical protein n=1 Tax=Sphingomonas sp. SRS2 TaxID=133190 RepID=UPI00128C7BF5|nr:hypothetical protein [Sphingomonas sp. SRS2]
MDGFPYKELADIPIPRDVQPGPGWSAQMREMADHIGAYDTLIISERYGGQDVYIPIDAAKNPFHPLIGAAKSRAISFVYGRLTLAIPTARYALNVARRASIIAAVRSDMLTVAHAARIMGVRRDYASKLVNRTQEGLGAEPPAIGRKVDPRQIDMFAEA